MDEQISIRIFALKYNLNQLKIAYETTKRDALLDAGLKYGVQYEDNQWYREKQKSYENLKKEREYILFTYIVNFTQCYYMIKEYLIKLLPQYSVQIEGFFSNSDNLNLPRKLISNDLKHNPKNDIEYDFRGVKSEINREGDVIIHTTYMEHSWFYKNLETVEYCNRLYNELEDFIKNLKIKDGKTKNTYPLE